MNCLLIFPEEVISAETVLISGSRAKELIALHDLKPGICLKIALLNNGLGTGEILNSDENELRIRFALNIEPPPRKNIELIIAICRPQTNKKVLHLAASFGVKRLNLIKSENTEKSYLQSKSLVKENINKEMFLAIEQSFDCYLPEVNLYSDFASFRQYMKQKDFSATQCIISDTPKIGTSDCLDLIAIDKNDETQKIIAVGPEAGWSENDRKSFSDFGFKTLSLGPRLFRTEIALSLLLGKTL